MGVGGQRHAPATLSSGMTRYPLYRRLGKPQCLSGRVPKISPLPGFDPLTAQPVASRYTDWAISAYFVLQDWNYNAIC
jgi:hypothetical protein